jgi:SRSO17 transposase
MDVQASLDALPALQEVLGSFHVRFRRPEGAEALARDLTGRLTELPTKNGDTLAQAVPGAREQRLQACLTTRPWDAADLHRQRVEQRITEATLGAGVLVLDAPGFPKQGQASVGVARQYSGTLGKVGHGQIAVTCGDTDPQALWPVTVRLSLPQAWATALERRGHARVPAAVTCQTQPERTVARREQTRAWGVPHRCVVADAGDGDDPDCLASLDARQERDVMGRCADCRVSYQPKATSPVQRADQLLQALPRGQGRTMRAVCRRAVP